MEAGINKEASQIVQWNKVKQTESRSIEMMGKTVFVQADMLEQYLNHKQIEACKAGCPNYENNWSCPPYSKDYAALRKPYKYACLIALSTYMNQYADITDKESAIKTASGTLKAAIEKLARHLEREWKGYALLCGTCSLCESCQCKIGRTCRHPEQMRYSVEATHLDVGRLAKEKLNHPLLWHQNEKLAEYTTTIALVLTNVKLETLELTNTLNHIME